MIAELAAVGIHLRHPDRIGEHRARCPRCDRTGPDDALAVRVLEDGRATWTCHRCGWSSATRAPRAEWHPARPPLPKGGRGAPERHDTLATTARAFWGTCRAIAPGDPAGRYLTGRGCALPRAGAVRWHPEVKHKPTGWTGPALVALVSDIETCLPITLHRTWLAPDGSGKAAIDPPRLFLAGHRARGVVRLWPDDEVTLGLVLGEGLETCLAAAAAGLAPIWSTLSAETLASFPVLPGIEGLTILVDHDKPNPRTGRRAGTEAACELIARYAAAGFDPVRDLVVIWPPDEGTDFNDLVHA